MPSSLFRVDANGRIRALQDAFRDATELMETTGASLVARAQKAFREQRRGRHVWARRMTPNVAGVVSDLNAGRTPRPRRFQEGPALRDTGLLMRSIAFRATRNTVIVGTVVPYAQIHQAGGTSRVMLRRSGRRALAQWLRRNRRWGADLGWLFSQSTFTIRVRRRPFLGFDREDLEQFREDLAEWIEEVTGGDF